MSFENLPAIHIYRTLKASPDQVFKAWLDKKSIGQWITKPTGDKVVKIETEARPGTEFSFRILRDGKEVNHVGEYIEVRPPHRLVFTWGVEGYPIGGSRVAIDFEPNEGGTNVTLTHRLTDAAWAEQTKNGWNKIISTIEETI